jgi:hypothetical protein
MPLQPSPARGGVPLTLAAALSSLRARYATAAAHEWSLPLALDLESRPLAQPDVARAVREIPEIEPIAEVQPVPETTGSRTEERSVPAVGSAPAAGERALDSDLGVMWTATLARLERRVSPANYAVWLRNTRALGWNGEVLRIGVPNRFAEQWIETRFRRDIQAVLAALLDRPARVMFEVVPFDEPAAGSAV